MSRLERLLNLTAALLAAERPLTAEDLRERVAGYPPEKASFRRQFERDKDALRELGLPLQVITPVGHEGAESQAGYRIAGEDYYLRDPGLAPDEAAALHLAARLVRIEGLDDADAAWKLGRADAGPTPGDPSGAAPAATLPASGALAALFAAIAAGRRVGFTYRDEERSVVPRTLSFRNGHWYLAGYDLDRGERRSFRLDRFTSPVVSGPPTDDPEPPAPGRVGPAEELHRPWEIGTGEPVEALVRVEADQAAWAVLHLGEDAVRERGTDGSVTVALAVRTVDAFRSFVLGFLDHAEVLAPAALRDELCAWLAPLASVTSPAPPVSEAG